MKRVFLLLVVIIPCFAQALQKDGRVLLQSFTWTSNEQGGWYNYLRTRVKDIQATGIDVIWLPPPSQGEGAGYHPQQLNSLSNNYGSDKEHQALLKDLRQAGILPIADVVLNHRQGTNGWAVFENPAWPSNFICSTDEFWKKNPSELPNQKDRDILSRGQKGGPDYTGSDYPDWPNARDMDHSNSAVRAEYHKYLATLRRFGYEGWRYDMAKGIDPRYFAEYTQRSGASFSVGEYWDGDLNKIAGWVRGSGSAAFDFPGYYGVTKAIRDQDFPALAQVTQSSSLIAHYPAYAVTFLENHDTGKPLKPDDSLPNDARLMQGYAYLLTHPGIPNVFWKHFDDWNHAKEISDLIHARKTAKVHSTSSVAAFTAEKMYVAYVGEPGKQVDLVLHLGLGEVEAPKAPTWRLVASGVGYKVWIRK